MPSQVQVGPESMPGVVAAAIQKLPFFKDEEAFRANFSEVDEFTVFADPVTVSTNGKLQGNLITEIRALAEKSLPAKGVATVTIEGRKRLFVLVPGENGGFHTLGWCTLMPSSQNLIHPTP